MNAAHRYLPFAVSLFALAACNADVSSDDDVDVVDTHESELQAACVIGTSCPAAISLLQAKSFAPSERPAARFRTDLAIVGPNVEPTPRIIRQATSRPLTLSAGKTLKLAGDAKGRAAITIDDDLLVEVLDAASGTLLDAAYFGTVGDIQRAGTPLRRLGAAASSFDAGSLEIHTLIPQGKSIRLRVTALDHGGSAGVSAVFVQVGDADVAPPPTPTDRSCSSKLLTADDVMRLLPAGQTKKLVGYVGLFEKERQCTSATGCGDWSPWRLSGHGATVTLGNEKYLLGPDYVRSAFRPTLTLDFGPSTPDSTCKMSGGMYPAGFSCSKFKYHSPFLGYAADRNIELKGEVHEGCISLTGSAKHEMQSDLWAEYAYEGLVRP
jgi:hypothetical protein